MAKFPTVSYYLDKSFTDLPLDTNISEYKQTYVEKRQKLNQYKRPMETKYVIHDQEGTITIDESYYKAMAKLEKSLDADQIAKRIREAKGGANNIEIKKSKLGTLSVLGFLFGILVIIGGVASYFALSAEKNFTGETKDFTENDSVELGDFVTTSGYYLDSMIVEETTVTTNYGIETSRSTSNGNLYILMEHEEGETFETYVYSVDSNSEKAQEIFAKSDATPADEYLLLEELEGEVSSVEKIENLDEGAQIIDVFKESIDGLNSLEGLGIDLSEYTEEELEEFRALVEYEYPVYLIDGRVKLAEYSDVLIPSIAITIAGLALFLGGFVARKKYLATTEKEARIFLGSKSSNNSSPIQRNK